MDSTDDEAHPLLSLVKQGCLLLLLSCPACYALSLARSQPIRLQKAMISAGSALISSLWDRNVFPRVSHRSWLQARHFPRRCSLCFRHLRPSGCQLDCWDAQDRYGTSWPALFQECPSKTRGVVASAWAKALVWRIWYFLGCVRTSRCFNASRSPGSSMEVRLSVLETISALTNGNTRCHTASTMFPHS